MFKLNLEPAGDPFLEGTPFYKSHTCKVNGFLVEYFTERRKDEHEDLIPEMKFGNNIGLDDCFIRIMERRFNFTDELTLLLDILATNRSWLSVSLEGIEIGMTIPLDTNHSSRDRRRRLCCRRFGRGVRFHKMFP